MTLENYDLIYDRFTGYIQEGMDVNKLCEHNWLFQNRGEEPKLCATAPIKNYHRVYAPKDPNVLNYRLVKNVQKSEWAQVRRNSGWWYSFHIPDRITIEDHLKMYRVML